MNPKLQQILDTIQQSAHLTAEEKAALAKTVADAEKDFAITAFKLDRTEKVKQTTAILLEETIAELEQKRQAVEKQNQELEIESALERLRAQAMGMQKVEDLPGVCELLFNEFRSLGFQDLRNAMINIHDDEHGSFINYDYSDAIGKTITPLTYDIHPLVAKQMQQIRSRDDAFSETSFAGEDLKTWIAFRKNAGEPDDPRIENADALHYYFYSIGTGSVGISTFTAISTENQKVLLRFRNVFAFAYRRYMEVTLAEEQAREAQIELALERVRARTMAMQKSDELKNAAALLFQQVKALGVPAYSCGYNIWEKDEKEFTSWMSTQDGSELNAVHNIPLTEDANFIRYVESKQKDETFFVLELRNERMQEHYEYLKTIPAFKAYFDYAISAGFIPPKTQIHHIANFSKGNLLFITLEPCPDYHDVFKRFAAVFEQTYTRFLDLQKAEAQAREAQIETGLERVRSRSLAMHHTSELQDVIHAVHKELLNLNIAIHGGSFIAINRDIDTVIRCWGSGGTAVTSEEVCLPLYEKPFCTNLIDRIKSGPGFFTEEYTQKEKRDFFTFLFKHEPWSDLDAIRKKETLSSPGGYTRSCCVSQHTSIFIINHFGERFSAADNEILKRFGKVFEQTYTRFLDLQKAEAQARESKIEAALEKVRSRTMAMQRSDELSETAAVLFQEFKNLGEEEMLQITIGLYDEVQRQIEFRVTSWAGDGQLENRAFNLSMEEPTLLKPIYQAWKEGKRSVVADLKGERLEEWLKYRNANSGITVRSEDTRGRRVITCAFFSKGHVSISSPEPRSPETVQLLERFAGVFDLTYTRFLDLKNAEAQAREAQIEAAMERTRTQSMIMQHSSELDDTLRVFHQQVLLLGIPSAFSFLWLPDENKDRHIFWAAWAEKNAAHFMSKGIDYPLDRNEPATAQCLVDWKGNEPVVSYHVPPDGVQNYFAAWSELIAGVEQLKPEHFSEGLYYVEAFMKYGCFGVIVSHELKEEEKKILARFATEFERTYTRFLDLQKAESQAREAQVEAALERVRSKTMAMHNSQDVGNTVATMFDQLVHLGIKTNRCGILIFSTTANAEVWTARSNPDGNATLIIGHLDVAMHPMLTGARQAWTSKASSFSYELKGDDIVNYYQSINNQPGYPVKFNMDKIPAHEFHSDFIFPEGAVFAFTSEPIPEESALILKRFSGVFGQTYRRYLDLQRAEAQAREAQISAALERVRSSSLAMHRSDELQGVVNMVIEQLKELNIELDTTNILIFNNEKDNIEFWTGSNSTGRQLTTSWQVPGTEHAVMKGIRQAQQNSEDVFLIYLSFEQKNDFFNYLFANTEFKKLNEERKKYIIESKRVSIAGALVRDVAIQIISYSRESFSPNEIELLKRFAKVFEQAYTRFNDLKQAEAQAVEAIKRASVDRIRAEIASMRTTSDLERIQPLIWNELKTLGIPFIRCGVFIMDVEKEEVQTFLSTPDGKSIAAFRLPYFSTQQTTQIVTHWQQKQLFKDHMDEAAFAAYTKNLVLQGAVASDEKYVTENQPTDLHLHFLPFLQGMLYVGNDAPLNDEELQLVQNLADAFSTAYARYEDFNKLEAAKKQVDSTLNELQATQKQLIQSEKMASLGELTAGIAHEIQNPLNFVNNFSEVNTELIDEMKQEIENGNLEEAKALADDIRDNQEKITQHGKRADGIVKGMLQHSRSSSGVKEPTDINALADEYLRLAYHGLRAKDKTFNVTMHTDYDPAIGKISVLPQDIGRVILNLITNAFYVVDEKKKASVDKAYEPTVTVATKLVISPSGGPRGVLISVKDNGNGIPKHILDKIFQPFFTTKPTGKGTGLGLSLSYDIVKAHGGVLKVETKHIEGLLTGAQAQAGSEFIIQLPVTS